MSDAGGRADFLAHTSRMMELLASFLAEKPKTVKRGYVAPTRPCEVCEDGSQVHFTYDGPRAQRLWCDGHKKCGTVMMS